jgi:uncharacterized membrane protein YccF (DUF307 family)
MNFLGNLLWIFLGGGIAIFAEYLMAAIVLACTVIGIPFAIQCLKMAMLGLTPFGKAIVPSQTASGCASGLLNVLWMITGGLVIALTHIVFALLCAITIIGLPFAKQHIKLAGLAFTPFGKEIRG